MRQQSSCNCTTRSPRCRAPRSGPGTGTTGGPSTLTCPAPAVPSPTSLGFLTELERDMAADPPAVADGAVVEAMGAAGIAPGRSPGSTSSAAAAYVAALGLGDNLLAAAADDLTRTTSTGWARGLVVGSYGTDYRQRAYVAKVALGLQVPTQAVYFTANQARSAATTGTPLEGTRRYEISFSAGDLPPHGSDGFWSVTLYNPEEFLVANPIDRYSIGNTTPGIRRGADGSLTIVVAAARPAEADVNWLPAPPGAFMLVLRVYDPTPQVLEGSWSPPAIQVTG